MTTVCAAAIGEVITAISATRTISAVRARTFRVARPTCRGETLVRIATLPRGQADLRRVIRRALYRFNAGYSFRLSYSFAAC
jgi:hypothetical protein